MFVSGGAGVTRDAERHRCHQSLLVATEESQGMHPQRATVNAGKRNQDSSSTSAWFMGVRREAFCRTVFFPKAFFAELRAML